MQRKIAFVLIALVTLTGVTSTSVIAQENATTTETQADSNVIQISQSVYIEDYKFEGSTVTIQIYAEYSQNIVLSDMYVKGNGAQRIERKALTLTTGSNEVTFETTVWKGYSGVAIATGNGAVALTNEQSTGNLFTNTYSGENLALFLGVGFFGGIGLVGVLAYKKELDIRSEVRREL